jgi:hypothetical protein
VVSDIGIRQNYYRFYVHNNQVTPTDPWPPGVDDLGDNAVLTVGKQPLARGDKIRIRMTALISNDTMPAGYREFKLQYGLRSTTCSAVSSWTDVGSATSSAIWRGFTATGTTNGVAIGTDPPTLGDLLIIAVANRAGRLSHQNPSVANPYAVPEGDNVEYDWQVEHNGAVAQSTYCFRMALSDGTALDGYLQYPQIRTASYNPVMKNWRWYDDVESATPNIPLATENTAPINVSFEDTIALRISVQETKDVSGTDVRFRLQFSDDISFVNPRDVGATSTCSSDQLWCYVDGALLDNATTASSTLSDADPCTAGAGSGCGRQISSPLNIGGHTHAGFTTQEYSVTLRHAGARAKAVYYFRLYDTTNAVAIPLDTGESYPSLLTEAPTLDFSITDLPAGTATAGIVTDATTTASTISFGRLSLNTDYEAAQRLSVGINATEGYRLLVYARQQLMNSSGDSIPPVTATNAAPAAWLTACQVGTSTGCVGYHTTDPTLEGGSSRFAPNDTYAGLSTSPVEIMYSSLPTTTVHDIVYRVRVGDVQPAGDYETEIVYLAVPVH